MNRFDVDLIGIEDCRPLLAIRSCLEEWDRKVVTHWIGQPNHLVAILDGNHPLSQHVTINAHGDELGFKMMELGTEFQKGQCFNGNMGPADVRKYLTFQGNTVLSTACMSGTAAMGEAFLSAGASQYIAPDGYPEANAALYYALSFYYHLFCNNLDVVASHARASDHDDETRLFKLYAQ